MKNIIVFIFFLATGLIPSFAQQVTAQGGPNGVFIQYEKLLHGAPRVIERLQVGGVGSGETWKHVYTSDKGPVSAVDLIGRLTVLTRKNPFYELPDDSLATLLYDRYRSFSTMDSLGVYAFQPQYLEAFGIGFLDTAVVQGQRYDYRVRLLKSEGAAVYHNPSTVGVPGSKLQTTARSIQSNANGTTVKIKYQLKRSRPDIAAVRVLRATYGQTDFQECGAQWGFRKGTKDSLFVDVTDFDVRRKMVYSYVILLRDFLGNESEPSDTVTISNLRDQESIPSVYRISTRSMDAENGIAVSWKLSTTQDLRAVEVWRSETFDQGYQLIGTALPSDTVYLDQQVEPVKGYYYQIKLNGTYARSPQSVKVSGMLKANKPALLAPAHFNLTETKDSLFFRWQAADYDTRAYYLYFAEKQMDSLRQYSDIILSTDRDVSFQVPVKNLIQGAGYRWAVAAVNTSYQVGPMSELVFSQVRVPERLATPLNPEMLYHQGHALLVWENMTLIDPYITGYVISRKKEGEKVFKEIYRQSEKDLARNSYEDFTVKPGQHYEFRVQAMGLEDKMSASSPIVTYFQEQSPVLPVRGISVNVTNKGVRVAWDAPFLAADKFLVYRYTEKTIAPKLIGSVTGQFTEFVDKYASPGIGYSYSVVVVDADKRESAPTDQIGVQWK